MGKSIHSSLADEIRAEMLQIHEKNSWAVVGEFMGKSPAYAMRTVRGDLNLSDDAIDAWIVNYRKQYAGRETVRVCPTCGVAHVAGDCHGKSGPVIVLAENQRVVEEKPKSAPKGRKRFRPDMTESQYNRWLAMSKEERVEVMGE